MRKIFLAIVCLVIINSLHAQISQGQKMIGGQISVVFIDNNNTNFFGLTKTTMITVAPQIGFGLSKNWIVGGGVGLAHQSQKTGPSTAYSKNIVNIYTVALFARKFHAINDKVGVYAQLDVGTGFGKSKEEQVQSGNTLFSEENDVSNYTAIVRPGFYFKVTKRIVVEAAFGGLGYTSSVFKQANGTKNKTNEFNFTLTSSFGLGFEFIF